MELSVVSVLIINLIIFPLIHNVDDIDKGRTQLHVFSNTLLFK